MRDSGDASQNLPRCERETAATGPAPGVGEERLRRLAQAARLGLYEWSTATDAAYCSPEACELFGVQPATPVGVSRWLDCVHPADRASLADHAEQVRNARAGLPNVTRHDEYRVVHPDGRVLWLEATTTFLAVGGDVLMQGVVRDITDRKQAEQAAQRRLQELEHLYRTAPVGQCALDADLRFIRINERLAEINGVPAAAHIGKTVREVLPALADVVEPQMRRILQTGEPRLNVEVVSETPARPGVRRSWLEQWLPVKDHAGLVTGLSIVVEETTARRQAEESLETQRRLLETVIEHMPAAVALIRGDDLRLQLVNSAYEAIAPGKATIGNTLNEIWPETGRDFSALCRRVLETGDPHQAVDEPFTIQRSTGGPVDVAYFSWSLHRVRIAGDGSWGILNTAWETTARKQAELALTESEANLGRAQEVGQMGWWRLDTRRNILTWSDENYRIFGVPRGTPLTYQTFLECIHPDDRQDVDARWQARVSGEPYEIEHRIVVGSRVKWVREKAYLELDDSGSPCGGFGITQDITDRKQAEEAFRESEARLKLAQRSAGAGVWSWDVPGGTLAWSEELFLLFGLDPATSSADFESWRGVIHPDDRDEAQRRIETAIAERTPLSSEYRIVLPSGEVRWVIALGDTTYDQSGRPQRMSGICLDVTARKAAEAELRSAEEKRQVAEAIRIERQRFLGVLETLPAMVCLLTPDHQVVFANRAFRETFGEADGRRCYQYRFGHTAPCDFCESFGVLATGRPHRWEMTTPRGMVLAAHDFPFVDADGSTLVLEVDLDITEQRRAEEALLEAHAALAERASRLRALAGDLTLTEQRERRRLARVLHDHVQQLLVAAKLRVAVMGRVGDASTEHAATDVDRLLNESISSVRVLTAELSPPVLHDSGLPAGLRWLARWMADKHGLQVDLSLADDLPPLAEDARVLLFESVRELLFNVVKHASVPRATVSIRRTEDDEIRITVADSGRGFDPNAAKAAGESAAGFGLMSIRERLELLGGRLDIESTPHAGSRLSLTAPLVGLMESPAPAATSGSPAGRAGNEPPAGRQRNGRTIRVLIADDHPVVREGFRRLLAEEPDMEVAGEAADGVEAVKMAGTLRPDVILMDVSMPRLDGIEATFAIRRDHPGIRVIGLSMFDDPDLIHAMRNAGAADYLPKSGRPGDLLAAIRRAAPTPR